MTYGYTPSPISTFSPGFTAHRKTLGQLVRVSLGGIEGETQRPLYGPGGWYWLVQTITGWWETAPIETSTVRHPLGSGVLALSPQFGPRPISIGGRIIADRGGPGALEAALDDLGSIKHGVLVVDELQRGLCREADVRLTDMQVTRESNIRAAVTLSLQADDPRRYGSAVQELKNGSNTLLNPGNSPCFPTISLVGPHSALTITHPGGVYTFPALSTGQRRRIQGATRNVWAGDNRVFVGSGPYPLVEEGGARWTINGLGNGTATARRFEAWM